MKEEDIFKPCAIEHRLAQFKQMFGFQIPLSYLEFADKICELVFHAPPPINEASELYLGNGLYQVGDCISVDPCSGDSIFDNDELVEKWGLPYSLVLFAGDGFTWLALDYRTSKVQPKVVFSDTSSGDIIVIADNFNEFVKALKPCSM